MSQPQTVKVDQQEILSRADEVEAPMAVPHRCPAGTLRPERGQERGATTGHQRREHARIPDRRRQGAPAPGDLLRNAAKAYGDVDDDAATALNSDGEGHVEGNRRAAPAGTVRRVCRTGSR